MEQRISHFLQKYVTEVYFPNIKITDIVEVLILTFLIYQLMIWVKNTKAWMLMKGILVLAVFILVACNFPDAYDFVPCQERSYGYGDGSSCRFPAGTS